MNCRDIEEIVFLVGDNQLEEETLLSYRRHLEHCPGCARAAQHVQRLLLLVRQRCCRHEAPATLRLRILTTVRTWEVKE